MSLADKWRDIGRELGVPNEVLDFIQISSRQCKEVYWKDNYCFYKMFKWWRENGHIKTFDRFAKVVHSVGDHLMEKLLDEIHGTFIVTCMYTFGISIKYNTASV